MWRTIIIIGCSCAILSMLAGMYWTIRAEIDRRKKKLEGLRWNGEFYVVK